MGTGLETRLHGRAVIMLIGGLVLGAVAGCGASQDLGPAPWRQAASAGKADGTPMFWESYWNDEDEVLLTLVDEAGQIQGAIDIKSIPATETEYGQIILHMSATEEVVLHGGTGTLLSRPDHLDRDSAEFLDRVEGDLTTAEPDPESKADGSKTACKAADDARLYMQGMCALAASDPTDSLYALNCSNATRAWQNKQATCAKLLKAEADKQAAAIKKQLEEQKKLQKQALEEQKRLADEMAATRKALEQAQQNSTVTSEVQFCRAPLNKYVCVDINQPGPCKGGANTVSGACAGPGNIKCCIDDAQ